MPRALWFLLRLHFRGVFRRMLRGVRTPKGFIFLVLGILVLTAWLGPRLYFAAKMPARDPRIVSIVAPFAILGFCMGNLLASASEKAVTFTGAEVDFLFPGPFSRRSLLAFKLIKTALGTLFSTLFFSILLIPYCGSWIACCVGIWLTIQFMQLFSMAVVMIGQTLGERVYGAARRGVILIMLVVAAIVVAPKLASRLKNSPIEFMRQIHATVAGEVLLAPFNVFARTLAARDVSSVAAWGSLAVLIDLVMLAVVIGLDANYLETAANASQRRSERVQRMRRGGISAMSARSGKNLRIGQLPWLGGAGPIAWRQLTGAVRSSRGLLILLAIIAVGASSFLLSDHGDKSSEFAPLIGIAIWINLLCVSMLKFDFRDELDRLDLLRSLPIHPAAVATAEMIAPVLVLTLLQVMLLVAIGIAGIAEWPILLITALFAVPFNLLLVGIENLLFLMFPLRAAGLIAGDMQLFGRQMVVFICKFLLLFVALAIAAAIGMLGYILGGQSWPAFGMVAWPALSLVAIGTIFLVARTFSRFDPSIDTPT